jgi:SlyX protein
MEKRITRLEENAFFQEKYVEELNAALTEQQRQMDEMARWMDEMRAQLDELRLLLEDARAGAADVPPPHYNNE